MHNGVMLNAIVQALLLLDWPFTARQTTQHKTDHVKVFVCLLIFASFKNLHEISLNSKYLVKC